MTVKLSHLQSRDTMCDCNGCFWSNFVFETRFSHHVSCNCHRVPQSLSKQQLTGLKRCPAVACISYESLIRCKCVTGDGNIKDQLHLRLFLKKYPRAYPINLRSGGSVFNCSLILMDGRQVQIQNKYLTLTNTINTNISENLVYFYVLVMR